MGIYMQWKAKDEFNANDREGITRQVNRLKMLCGNIDKICKDFPKILICKNNDPLSCPGLRALSPIWDMCFLENQLVQINFKNTWHRAGEKSSLLDLIYLTVPQTTDGVVNTPNVLSEHDCVKIDLHTKEQLVKPQFSVQRIYKNLTYNNLINLLDEDQNKTPVNI